MRELPAHTLLSCIESGDLETDRDGDTLMLLIGSDRIFESYVNAKLSILIELDSDMKSDIVIVRANNENRLQVKCDSRDDAAEVASLLARSLFVPIAD